jgi:FtsH-binding integral membrane protein
MENVMYRSATEVNDGMIRVYNHMMLAVINSMIVSYLVSHSPALMQLLFSTPLKWVIIFSPLVLAFVIPLAIYKGASKTVSVILLHAFAAVMGLCMSTIFVVYTSTSIASAFMSAAVLFAVMSFYGYFTRTCLDSIGKYLLVGLIAIVIASVINVFLGNSMLQMIVSACAVILFLGLTAYDTQRIRNELMTDSDHRSEITGALSLYLNFINLFTNLLTLFGNKQE